ncbi:MAG: hypothetical protein NTY55_11840 [Flavobacteriia bacterium]|nr:hypothetical protein [Flavobacteriia bacterium]
MDKIFKLTAKEFAKSVGITVECLYSRIRRGKYDGLYISKNKLLLFKRMRPCKSGSRSNDNNSLATSPPSLVKNTIFRSRRRGAHASGLKTKYPNYAFQQHNEIKMLARLKGKVSEEVINEITPATIKLAQEKVLANKQRRLMESYKPIKNYGSGIYNAKAATPKYKAIGDPMPRDDDKRNWVHDLPGPDKKYYEI